MAELTNTQLHQIRQALITGKFAAMQLENKDHKKADMTEIQAALDLVDSLLSIETAVITSKETPAAPEKPAAKAKKVTLSPAQLEMAHKIDYAGTLRIARYTQQQRTADAMCKKGLVEVTETQPDAVSYGLTEAGYAALSNR